MKNLVIVESPAKAKTIEKFLGKEFNVVSSYGHIRDLPEKKLSIDIENNFTPHYEISTDKKKVVTELSKLSKQADIIWLATDEDREGEAISWHLIEALKLDKKKIKRIAFHEITKDAILSAIQNPRPLNYSLVDAQQARRILDRLVGYELSPVLWKKVRPSLSAGRVQSVAVRLIVEREKEIRAFIPQSSFRVIGKFQTSKTKDSISLESELNFKFSNKEDAKEFLKKCISATFKVQSTVKKPAKRSPSAPFTTSTLQQEASRKLGYSVSKTMLLAQHLYESGKITYMRTDSVNLSNTAINASKSYITSTYGKEFSQVRQYTTKTKGAQEAHEAIRPTDMYTTRVSGDTQENRLYELIWKRTIASQMSDAQLEKTVIHIDISTDKEHQFIAEGEMVVFPGFLQVYFESTDDDIPDNMQKLLPALKENQELFDEYIEAQERFTRPAARYSEASLVKKLEELGIGRPSTYAPVISTIQKRGYAEKKELEGVLRQYAVVRLEKEKIVEKQEQELTGADKGKLIPSDIGILTTSFLTNYFETVLDYNFTAHLEEQFDDIAQGEKKWQQVIKNFYTPFHTDIERTLKEADRVSGERELGKDPKTKKPLIVRMGRFGPIAQIGDREDEHKKFASLRSDQSMETITLEEALKLFDLPRELGDYEGEAVKSSIGRFGPYIQWGKLFVSLKKTEGDDPYTIDLSRAIECIKAKQEQEANKYIKTFTENEDVAVLNGRYGPYIKVGKQNVKIPKDIEPSSLTLEKCLALAEEQKDKKPKRFFRKKK